MNRKVGIFIPCFNCQNSIISVLNSFSPEVLAQVDGILVVDNSSSDETLDTLRAYKEGGNAAAKKLTVIENAANLGLGGSQKVGYRHFLDKDFSHVMIVHGDGQGNGNAITQNFLRELDRDDGLDVIFASRFALGAGLGGYSALRIIGNKFFNVLTYLLTGLKMSDAGTGILLYNARVLRNLPFDRLENGLHFNPQLNILIHEDKSLRKAVVPLTWKNSDSSSLKSISYCVHLAKILFFYGIAKFCLGRRGVSAFLELSNE